MLQVCNIGLFRVIVEGARQGNYGPFGVIQGCLDTGGQEHAAAMAVLDQLGVTLDELKQFTLGFLQHQEQKVLL